jgi:hypothetical protein
MTFKTPIFQTKTDVLLHFVNPRDNSVVDGRETLHIIDSRTEQLDPLFREFNVLDTVRLPDCIFCCLHLLIYFPCELLSLNEFMVLRFKAMTYQLWLHCF